MISTFNNNSFSNEIYLKTQLKCVTVTFQVTEDCNLNCSYCYQINKKKTVMSLDLAKLFIDKILTNSLINIFNFSNIGGIILEFIGGEPFLQVDLIDKILDYFYQQIKTLNSSLQDNWKISICTNGTLYFTPKVQHFLKKWNKFLSLGISIDGDKELHDSCRKFPNGEGSYDLAIKAALDYYKTPCRFLTTKATLSPENINFTSKALINLIELNYKEININCCFEKGWENKHSIILYNEMKKLSNYILNLDKEKIKNLYISLYIENFFHPLTINENQNWCGSNSSMIAMDYKGDLYPCIRFMPSSLGENIKPLKIGNIKTGITEEEQKNYNCLKCITRLSQSTEECINCPIAAGCAWCTAYNYQDSGDFNHRATYICCMHKARSLANAYFWNSYYRKYNENKRFKIWLPDEEALKIIDTDELAMLKELQKPIE